MNPNLLQLIISLIVQLGPLAVEEFLKVEAALNLTPDEKVNVANAIASAHSSNADTIAKISAWMAANGMVAQVVFVPVPVAGRPQGSQP